MVRPFVIFSLFGMAAFAQSPSPIRSDLPVIIQLPHSEIIDVLHFYQTLTGRTVWLAPDVRGTVDIFERRSLPHAEAVALIRSTVEKAGFEFRDVGKSETFVTRRAESSGSTPAPKP
jgi:hypothetical protein